MEGNLMIPNLLKELQDQFSGSDVTSKIAQTLGESPTQTVHYRRCSPA
jgi:hypothetical protein